MPDPSSYPPSQPPPIPYAGPAVSPPTPTDRPLGPAQKVFDTVTGPNVRLFDNLVQLACVIAGGGIGALVGSRYGSPWPVLGIIAGVFGALVVSGIVIGVVRFVRATRKP